jgi:hypothetical protein
VRPGLVLVVPLLLAGCASATVVENKPGEVVLRWDEGRVSRSTVVNQAIDLCGDYGFSARRAIAIADQIDGTVHTTRFVCKALRNLPVAPATPGAS